MKHFKLLSLSTCLLLPFSLNAETLTSQAADTAQNAKTTIQNNERLLRNTESQRPTDRNEKNGSQKDLQNTNKNNPLDPALDEMPTKAPVNPAPREQPPLGPNNKQGDVMGTPQQGDIGAGAALEQNNKIAQGEHPKSFDNPGTGTKINPRVTPGHDNTVTEPESTPNASPSTTPQSSQPEGGSESVNTPQNNLNQDSSSTY